MDTPTTIGAGIENAELQGFEKTKSYHIKQMKFVNEPGLYQAIFGSKKESAIKFQKWVFEEVLPSLRKHGVYVNNQENKSVEQIANDITKAYVSIIEEKTNKLIQQEESLSLLQDTIKKQKEHLLLQQEQYNNLKQDYTSYQEIHENKIRLKMLRKKFTDTVNKISRNHNIPHNIIYGTVYHYYKQIHKINSNTKIIDFAFKTKERALEIIDVLHRLERSPYYFNIMH